MSTSQTLLFSACAVFALVGAFGTVLADNPLRAAMSLLVSVLAMAGLYLSLHAELLATLQMIVYAGAVVVLFVFVIMLIGPDGHRSKPSNRMFAAVLAAIFFGQVTFTIAAFVGRGASGALPRVPASFGSVEGLGEAIFVRAAVPFEAISVTLLVAILAAIAVARGRTKDEAAVVVRDRDRRASLPPEPDHGDAA